MKAMIYLQAFVSSKDALNIGTAIVKDPDTGLSCKYNFYTDYTPGSEPTDTVTHQLLVVDDLEADLSNRNNPRLLANISSKALKSISEYMEIDGADIVSKNVVFSEECGIMWRKDLQVETNKYLNIEPGSRAATNREKTENKLIEAAKENNSKGYTKPKRLKGYKIEINEIYGITPEDTEESDKYERDIVFNARYAELENVQKLRRILERAKHSSESIFAYDSYGEPVAFKAAQSYDPFPVPAGFKEEVDLFSMIDSNHEYIPGIVYKEALVPDFQSGSVQSVDIEDLDDMVHTRYYAFLSSWDECKILHRIVLRTVEVEYNSIDVKSEELVIDNLTLVKILQKISIRKGVPDNNIPPVTVNSLYGPMWLHKKTCFVDDKSIGDYTKRAAEAFSNKYEDITKYYEPGTLAENNHKALEAAIQIRQWMVDPPTSCDKYSVSNRLIDNFARELLPFNHYYKHTDIFRKSLGKSGIKKVLGYTANKRITEFGRLKAEEQAAEQKIAEQAAENQASGAPEKGIAILRYTNSSGVTTKYEIQFEDLSLETLTIMDLAKNILTGKMEIDNIEIKEDNGRKKLVCTSSDIETVKDSD